MQRLRHPIRSIREPFGKAGLTVAILALVFAMVGGAWAAVGLNSKQKKEVTKIAKKYAGKPGAAGANGTNGAPGEKGAPGAAGAAGSNGTNGTNGTAGTNGTNGKTVLSGTATPTGATGTDGDFYIETDVNKIYGPKAAGAWPAGVDLKGPEGSPWTTSGTLPSTKTETGAWSVPNGGTSTTISFPIPLAAEIAEANTHYVTTPGGSCTGTSANPTAAAGHLCVYKTSGGTYSGFIFKPGSSVEVFPGVFIPEEGASKTGAAISSETAASEGAIGFVSGTFAVTAP